MPAVILALLAQVALTRGPYLQQGTPGEIVIVWRTAPATAGWVRWGPAPDQLSTEKSSACSGIGQCQHEVRLTGLPPATLHYYSVGYSVLGGGNTTLAGGDTHHRFLTAPARGSRLPFRLWVLGDSGTGSTGQIGARDAMLAEAGSRRPDLLLHMGDIAYTEGTDLQFSSFFFTIYQSILRHTVTWPAMGNHEGVSADSATQKGPYYDAFVLPKAGEAGGLPSGTEAYYSFDYANVHFVVLDSHESPRAPDGAMLRWMKDDLAATDQDWIVAYWHHPPYTKGTHDSDAEGQLVDMRENALPILEAAGVDLVLTGHSHIYERSYLVDGAYDTPTTAAGHIKDGRPDGGYQKRAGRNAHDGAIYVVAGHGGAGVGRMGTHPLMAITEDRHGSCLVDVDGFEITLRNVRADGVVSDVFTLRKPAPPASDGGTPDAGGADGGPPDAGQPDAGAPDAGAPDAGAADAGTDPTAPPSSSGCSCGGAAALFLVGLVLLPRNRRRYPRCSIGT